MSTITRAGFAVSWTTQYPSLFESDEGRLSTRAGYEKVFYGQDVDLLLPWERQRHPSWFWSRYLVASVGRVRTGVSPDALFDRVVPFRWVHPWALTGPEGSETQADVFLYPSAVSVVFRATFTGKWPLEGLADALEALREAKTWGLDAEANRSLDGLAGNLRDEAAKRLTLGAPPVAGYETILTVAAPMGGKGAAASFDVGDETVRSCLAGLAALGPPGTFDETRLLGENSDSKRRARIYALGRGHAIWHPEHILKPLDHDPIGCLLHNQTALVVHIAVLDGIVQWAEERLKKPGGIPGRALPLVRAAVERLQKLHEGRIEITYRSGLAKQRIEPLLPRLAAVSAAL